MVLNHMVQMVGHILTFFLFSPACSLENTIMNHAFQTMLTVTNFDLV